MKTTTITAMIQQYDDGDISWDDLLLRLARYPYDTPSRNLLPDAVSLVGRELEDVEFNVGGTFDEVRRARDRGLLTQEQFLAICEAADGAV